MKTFEEYLDKMGYSLNDFDRTYEMENLIEQYADEKAKQALSIADVMGWVAIDDHLPEKGDECWVCRKHGETEVDLFDGDWWLNQTYGGVTHWQKVVKPPCP